MKKTKYFAILLAMIIIFTSTNISFANSDDEINNKLRLLDYDYEQNLVSLREQLEAQNKIEHYEIHKENLDFKYKAMKEDIISLKNNLKRNNKVMMATSSNKYYLENGGKITYLTNPYGFEYNYYSEEYFTREQFLALRQAYMENSLENNASLIRILVDVLSNFIPVKYIGAVTIYKVFANMSDLAISKAFLNIYKSKEKRMNISTYSGDMGASSYMSVWRTYPYGYIRDDAKSIKVTRY